MAPLSNRKKTGDAVSIVVFFFAFLFLLSFVPGVPAQTQSAVRGTFAGDLRDFVATPAVPGHEKEISEKIRAELAALHPAVDNLGDVILTIGTGSPHRLIVTPIDEPGYIVSGITDDGYLRLQRVPAGASLPPIFNELYSAQPVKVGTTNGKWIDGVVAGISVHLQPGRANPPNPRDIDNMYVDIGATSAAEVRKAGVDNLCPVALNRRLGDLGDAEVAGASLGDKFGAAAVLEALREIDPSQIKGTLTVAFVTQQRYGATGLRRVLNDVHADEMIYVGRLLPGGPVAGVEGVHRAPRRDLGSGVLLGLEQTTGTASGLGAELEELAKTNKIPFAEDYSARLIPDTYLPSGPLPAKWAHIGIATAWPDTPAETASWVDLRALVDLLRISFGGKPQMQETRASLNGSGPEPEAAAPSTTVQRLQKLTVTYGASNHEGPVRETVKSLLPKWAQVETDDAGNLILHLGTAPPGAKTPKILVVAHMDEIGLEVKSISSDGLLQVEELGGMNLDFYQGHPALVHTASGDRDAVMELPNGWNEVNFKWPNESESPIRVDVGAQTPEEVAKLGIRVGDWITIPKEYRHLLDTRANGRSFDDRVGDTALISAVWALGGPLKDRDVTFVWSTGEELGLVGAGAVAKRLAAEGHEPDYVFAVDTFVSADSPLESSRFADAQIGKGFVIRAADGSNLAPLDSVERVIQLARANQIPVQYGVTGGGNDGAMFVPYGAVDIALGWPLRYSHSPGEVIDTRDVDALARIIAVIARSW